METLKTLLGRRTVHKYKSDPVPDVILQRALEAAMQAPNHKLTFPWRFITVGPKSRKVLFEIVLEIKSAGADCSDTVRKAIEAKVLNPGALVIVALKKDPDPLRAREDYAATSCAIQNLMLSLWNDGFGSKWTTGRPTRHEKTYALAGVDQNEEEIVGFVWGGIAECIPTPPTRPALEERWSRLP